MTEPDWKDGKARCLGMLLDGRAQPSGIHRRGVDQPLLLITNSHSGAVPFDLPEVVDGGSWRRLIDTTALEDKREPELPFGESYKVPGRSLLLFELVMDQSYATARGERKRHKDPGPA
jgi:isoamylase